MKENVNITELIDRLKESSYAFTGEYNTKETRERIRNRLIEEFDKYVCTDIETLGLVWTPKVEISEDKHTLKITLFSEVPY